VVIVEITGTNVPIAEEAGHTAFLSSFEFGVV